MSKQSKNHDKKVFSDYKSAWRHIINNDIPNVETVRAEQELEKVLIRDAFSYIHLRGFKYLCNDGKFRHKKAKEV